jgi:DNA-binding NarL/FixJ family response regulator
LQEQAIDMVLTDYSMPEMTGYDLLKAIKVKHTSMHCLQITAFADAETFLTTAHFSGVLPGAGPPETDTGGRHVIRERAPAHQQVTLFFQNYLV